MTKRLIFALLFSCSPLWATTYYVDNCVTVGNDRNNGTSTSTPWLTINKVNTSTFNPGDSILFQSTCTWSGTMLVPPSSGSSGGPITYGSYGTGARPIIAASGATHALQVTGSSHINFQNLVFNGGTSHASYFIGASYINITNTDFTSSGSCGIGVSNGTAFLSVLGGSIYNNGQASGTDSNGIGIGDYDAASHDITIDSVNIYSNWSEQIAVALTSTELAPYNITVRHCLIHNGGSNGASSSGAARGFKTSGGSTGLALYDNLIYGNLGAGFYANQSAGQTDSTVLVCNNVFFGNGSGEPTYPSNVHIGANNVTFKNNIVAQTSGTNEIDVYSWLTLTSDYNDFYHSAGGTFMSWAGRPYSFANWKTESGQDAHSISANPLFANPGAAQFWLASGSPAIDAGLNLGSPYNIGLMPGSTWPNSVVTGDQNAYGSGWEIGAFIYVSPVAPPSNLQVVKVN